MDMIERKVAARGLGIPMISPLCASGCSSWPWRSKRRVCLNAAGLTAGENHNPLSEKCQSVEVALLSADAGRR